MPPKPATPKRKSFRRKPAPPPAEADGPKPLPPRAPGTPEPTLTPPSRPPRPRPTRPAVQREAIERIANKESVPGDGPSDRTGFERPGSGVTPAEPPRTAARPVPKRPGLQPPPIPAGDLDDDGPDTELMPVLVDETEPDIATETGTEIETEVVAVEGRPPARTRSSPRRLILALVAALLVMAVAGFFLLRPSADDATVEDTGAPVEAIAFAYAFEAGQTRTYDFTMEIDATPEGAEPFRGTFEATMSMEVVQTQEDGSATLEATIAGARFDPAVEGANLPDQTLTIRVAPDGRVTKVEGGGDVFGAAASALNAGNQGASSNTASSQYLFPQFPDGEIRPGDEWTETSTVPLAFGDDTVTVTSKGRLEGYEESRYGRVARVNHEVDSPFDLSFPLAESLKQTAPGATVPPGAENAVVNLTGTSTFVSESLIVPASSDLVEMTGTATTSMRMSLEGVPDAPPPFSFDATMKISMVRVDTPSP